MTPVTPLYVETFYPDKQVSAEEDIAAIVFNAVDENGVLSEDAAAQVGRDVLRAVLWEFRPDLFQS